MMYHFHVEYWFGGTGSDGLPTISFSKFDLYACRLYTRVLSDTEIGQNYAATTSYHEDLVNKQ